MVQVITLIGAYGIDPAGAARIVDKFLWLKGSREPNRLIPQDAPENDHQQAMAAGTAIWDQLCENGLAEPPKDAHAGR